MGWTWGCTRSGAAALALLLACGGIAGAQPRGPASRLAVRCVVMDRPGLLAESAPGRIAFDDGAERVTLLPACGPTLTERVLGARGRRFILLVEDLRARQGSGTVFTLHLAEGDGGSAPGQAAVLGALNFFAARPPEAPGAHRSASYDVTRTVQSLARARGLDAGLVVLLAPSQPPSPEAALSVGRIQLVAQ